VKRNNFDIVKAIHPDWNGLLRLSASDKSVVHIGPSSEGKFTLSNGILTVYWEKYEPDVFTQVSDVFVHEQILRNVPQIERIVAVLVDNRNLMATKISVELPTSNYEVTLRLRTTGIPTFGEVFTRCQYESSNLPDLANVVVDLGANIGLASVFFGLRYPRAKIFSIEPEENNFALLVANTMALGDRVQARHAAVWVRDGLINLHTEGEDGSSLGEWGVQVSEMTSESSCMTKCFKLPTLLDQAGINKVDILKIDIEGAELELFSNGTDEWLQRIGLIIIETHDRFRPGSEEAVRNAVHPMFEELPRSGESLFFRRKGLASGSELGL